MLESARKNQLNSRIERGTCDGSNAKSAKRNLRSRRASIFCRSGSTSAFRFTLGEAVETFIGDQQARGLVKESQFELCMLQDNDPGRELCKIKAGHQCVVAEFVVGGQFAH
jgi:hypothetical protein